MSSTFTLALRKMQYHQRWEFYQQLQMEASRVLSLLMITHMENSDNTPPQLFSIIQLDRITQIRSKNLCVSYQPSFSQCMEQLRHAQKPTCLEMR